MKKVTTILASAILAMTLAGCGETPKPEHTHTYDTNTWKTNSEKHWHANTCSAECGQNLAIDTGNHVDASPKDNKCDVCGYDMSGGGHVHQFSTEWSTSSTKHWHVCSCGEKGSVGDHVDADPKDNKCDVCGYVMAASDEKIKNVTGGTAEEQKAIQTTGKRSIVTLSGSASIVAGNVTDLAEDKGDYVQLTVKNSVKISGKNYDVKLVWGVADPASKFFDEIVDTDDTHQCMFINYPGKGGEEGSLKLVLKEISCGDAKSVDTGLSYDFNVKASTLNYTDVKIKDLNKINNGPINVGDGKTVLDAGYDVVDYSIAHPFFKTNNPDAPSENQYYYVKAAGKFIYNAPDGNWGLIADGDQIMEVYAGSAYNILPSHYPQMKNEYVKVVGNMGMYQGNIQIGFVTRMIKATAADIDAEPTLSYQTITKDMISSIKTSYGMKQCVYGANLSNSLSQLTGKFVPGSIKFDSEKTKEYNRGARFTFDMNIDGEIVTIAYDYHTDKDASWGVGLFEKLDELVKDNGASTYTIKGTLRYCGDDSSPFIQNATSPGTWQLVPFLGDHVVKA